MIANLADLQKAAPRVTDTVHIEGAGKLNIREISARERMQFSEIAKDDKGSIPSFLMVTGTLTADGSQMFPPWEPGQPADFGLSEKVIVRIAAAVLQLSGLGDRPDEGEPGND